MTDLNAIAWVDCLRWAINDPDVLAHFHRDTGMELRVGATPIDRMIDNATGYSDEAAKRFLDWFSENVWGEPEPEGVRR